MRVQMGRYFVGFDVGSSFVKTSLFDAERGLEIAQAQFPDAEMEISAPVAGFAEQDPETWWLHVKNGFLAVVEQAQIPKHEISAFGISAQMHGLVVLDKEGVCVRPAIIWCDGRAVREGDLAYQELGAAWCHEHLLNAPGNFTASRLRWVQRFEPQNYGRIYKVMLPSDFIAFKLTGHYSTTSCSLSEAMLWDFQEESLAQTAVSFFHFDSSLFPALVPAIGFQGQISPDLAKEWGLSTQSCVSYRSGDQPNNAFSLGVNKSGDVAVTAGTSAVSYAITDRHVADIKGRVNTFLHPTYSIKEPKNGVLACLNGGGRWHSWIRSILSISSIAYWEMDEWAKSAPVGSAGLLVYPFGNGPERLLENQDSGAQVNGLRFSEHHRGHMVRAGMEGISYALRYGMDIMGELGVGHGEARAGCNNMFLSPVFQEIFASATQTQLSLYKTSGAEGAGRGAALGNRFYSSQDEAMAKLNVVRTVEPDPRLIEVYTEHYEQWKKSLAIG